MFLEAKGIKKSYESLQVLKGIDFEIEKGSIVSIIGKSGAGKSTLLHLLGTLDTPDAGTIKIDNQIVTNLNAKELAKFRNQKIGFVFQFHHLLPEFTALENVMIPALIQKINSSDASKNAAKLLDYLGLKDRMTHKPNELSGGEQQRVAIARALINEPAIILADEPTGNLDTQTSLDLHNLFIRLKHEMNQTFVIVTHNQELAKLSDRVVEMRDGLII
jgi:lipoprotein-releasing system ATP-binding protein